MSEHATENIANNRVEAASEVSETEKQLAECTTSLESCQKERDEWKEKYLYARADFDNAQRRMAKDMERLVWEGQAKVLRNLLDVLDDLERAIIAHEGGESGIALIHKQFAKVLHQAGVSEITEHDTFNPEIHEAVTQIQSDDHEQGAIVAVLQKGYRFNGEVLRPARVSIAQ